MVMLTLVCYVVGVRGAPIPVDIDASRTVFDLKQFIKATCPQNVPCSAELLSLYLTAHDSDASASDDTSGSWLDASSDDARALKRGVVPDWIQSHLHATAPMAATSQLCSHACFSASSAELQSVTTRGQSGTIHVLVALPSDSDEVAYFKRHLKWVVTLYFFAGTIILVSACATVSRSGLGDLVMLWLIFVTAVVVCQHFERELAYGRAELADAYRHMGYDSIP